MTSQPTVFQFPSFSSAVHWTNLRLRLAPCSVNFVASSNPAALGWSLTFLLQVALIKARRPDGNLRTLSPVKAGCRCCRGEGFRCLPFFSGILELGFCSSTKKAKSYNRIYPWGPQIIISPPLKKTVSVDYDSNSNF